MSDINKYNEENINPNRNNMLINFKKLDGFIPFND